MLKNASHVSVCCPLNWVSKSFNSPFAYEFSKMTVAYSNISNLVNKNS